MDDETILRALGDCSEFEDDSDEDPTWTLYERDSSLKLPPSRCPLSPLEEDDDVECTVDVTTTEHDNISIPSTSRGSNSHGVTLLDTSITSTTVLNRNSTKKTRLPKQNKIPVDPKLKFSKRPFPVPTSATPNDSQVTI